MGGFGRMGLNPFRISAVFASLAEKGLTMGVGGGAMSVSDWVLAIILRILGSREVSGCWEEVLGACPGSTGEEGTAGVVEFVLFELQGFGVAGGRQRVFRILEKPGFLDLDFFGAFKEDAGSGVLQALGMPDPELGFLRWRFFVLAMLSS